MSSSKNPLLFFLSAGTQMTLILCLGIFIGKYLDSNYSAVEKKTFTIIGTCVSLVLSLALFIKKALDITKDKKE